ncbi:hypothetical protein [Hydrogenophaga sp. 2FB]|uniref:hypothetical protein n=1 Tax=Hydrogenophaga sp. 2FB TaxID=2502187 RepID=UPI0010F72095|nr:hypothetical protein [Hydrogenophaga sp. 2FB]
MTIENEQVHLRFTLDAVIDTNGEGHQALAAHLEKSMAQAVGNGAITGHTAAEVQDYTSNVSIMDKGAMALSEDDLSSYFSNQIESGAMDLERIPLMMARLALRDPADVRVEIAERIEMLNESCDPAPASATGSSIAPPRPF